MRFVNFRLAIHCALLLLTTFPFESLAQWIQKSSPVTTGIYDILALNNQTLFIGTRNFIFKSSDGGSSWLAPTQFVNQFETDMLTSAIIEDIYFKNELEGYAIGGGFFGLYHVVAKTVDGGISWSLVYQDTVAGGLLGNPIKSMVFVNETKAFAVGGNGKIISSDDGGTSWNTNLPFTSNDLNKIMFLNNNIGFMVGNGLIAKTTNQGSTWSSVLSNNENFLDLYFYNDQSGIAISTSGNLYQTFDGGATWEINNVVSGVGVLGEISFSGSLGYITGNPGQSNPFILVTFDGGVTWQRQIPNTNAEFYSIAAIGSTIFSGSLNGKIMSANLSLSLTKPIAAFRTNNVNFCENVSYSFVNESYSGYLYEWRVDGILVSTNRDLQYQFPDGVHTIELTVKDGLRVGSKAIVKSFEGDYPFTMPMEVEFQNGLCEGDNVEVKITNPEFGTIYRLYDPSEILIAEGETNFPSVTLQLGNLPESQTFTLKASRSNSCTTFETQRNISITVHPIPTEHPELLVAVQDICNGGASVIDINNSDSNVQYDIYSEGGNLVNSKLGDGGVVHLSTNYLTDTTRFLVKASVLNSFCQRWFEDTLTVNVERVVANFAVSPVNAEIGELINFYNTSFGATSFQWSLPDGTNSSVINPVGLQFFVGAGTYPIRLVARSNSGCSDERTDFISLYADIQSSPNCWATGFNLNEPNFNPVSNPFELGTSHSIVSNSDGDIIVCGAFGENASFASTTLKTYATKWNLSSGSFLARYNSSGVLKWAFPIFRYRIGGENSEIRIGADGSIYLFTLGLSTDPHSYYSINGDSISMPGSVLGNGQLARYSNDGLLLETRIIENVLPSLQSLSGEMVFDIDDSGDIYLNTNRLLKIESGQNSFTVISNTSDNVAVCRDGSLYSIKYDGPKIEFTKFSQQGTLEWEQTIVFNGLNGNARPSFLEVDGNNNIYIATSDGNHSIEFPSMQGQAGHVTNSTFSLAKYNPNGYLEWVTHGLGIYTDIQTFNVSDDGTVFLTMYNSDAEIHGTNGASSALKQNHSPYFIQYSSYGVLEFVRPIFDKPVIGTGMQRHRPTRASATSDGLVVLAPGFTSERLGSDSVTFVSGVLVNEGMLITKISQTCGIVPEKITLSVESDDPQWFNEMCPGFSFDLHYSVDELYPIGDQNTFRVYLSGPTGNFATSQLVGSLTSSSRTGVIRVTMPSNISSADHYNLWVLGDSAPLLYSKAFDISTQLNSNTSLFYAFRYETNNLSATLNAMGHPSYDFEWTIDGKTFTGVNITYTFPSSGSYYVALKTTSECGISRTDWLYVDVFCNEPEIGQTYVINEQSVNFSANDIPGATYLWDFGDGITSTDRTPTHAFSTWGIKQIKLTITAQCGQKEVSLNIDLGCAPINPSISFTQTNLFVQFFNNSGYSENSFVWNFGDGQTSSEKNPTHTYISSGDYTVTFREFNACNEIILSQVISLACPLPSLTFTTNVTNQRVNLEASNGSLGILKWDFGDGSILASSGTTATHSYINGGIYSICITATSSCGVVSFCSSVSIACPILNPSIGVTQSEFFAQFENLNPTSGSTFLWLFGDGSTSTLPSPIHNYSTAGTYMVSLTESNDCSTTTVTKEVHVSCPVPSPQFSFTINKQEVSFQNESANATSYKWDFGDGTQSVASQSVLSHTYTSQGAFQVCLQAINACESIAICQLLVVCTPPEVDFTFETISVGTVAFNSSYNAVGYSWYFGDGNYSSKKSPQHDFLDGTYQVCLTLSNGCLTSQICKSVTVVCPKPIANFAFEFQSGTQVKLTNTSTNSTFTDWDFGDGAGTLEDSPVHEFQEGNFEVCLEVQNNCGVDQLCQTISIVLTGGIEDKPKWTVYPNPFEESIRIEHSFEGAVTIRVQSVLGVYVHTAALQESKTLDIDTRHWVAGIYILVIESRGKSQVTTLIKK